VTAAEEGPARPARARPARTRVLFVCLGNICRSPTAEGVMRALVSRAGLQQRIELESAGTGAWHVGSPPDARAARAARAHGIALEGSARQVRAEDFFDFDVLVAMDSDNMRELRRLAPGAAERAKVRLLREFDPASEPHSPAGRVADGGDGRSGRSRGRGDLDVPDPYYAAAGGFEEVFELVHAACAGLLEQLRDGLPARAPS
jgi:protein-tyrosine phosphatase